jgi:hypothetical protein
VTAWTPAEAASAPIRTAEPVTLTAVDTVVPTTDAVVDTTAQPASTEAISSKKPQRQSLHNGVLIALPSLFTSD